ncbi:MAG: hypothetical protein QOJ05_1456 [Verrucomicrobiota bacterium]
MPAPKRQTRKTRTIPARQKNLSEAKIRRAQQAAIARYLRPKHPDSRPNLRNADPDHNVVGIGIARKRTKERDRAVGITFYVRHKLTPDQLKQWPALHRLPKKILGVPTDVMEAGEPRLLGNSTVPARPAHPGAQITVRQPNGMDQFGTFGALVEDDAGRRYVLCNNHVLSDFGQTPAGTRVFQPAPPSRFARLSVAVPIDPTFPNDTDCALASLDSVTNADGRLRAPLGPLSSAEPAGVDHGTKVAKRGAVTGLRRGTVHSPAFAVDLGGFKFENLIQIEDDGAPFCDHGDSGALIVDRDTRAPVALLMGRMGNFNFACSLDRVLARLSAALGSNLRLIIN